MVISVTDFFGNVTTREVNLNVEYGRSWPLPYTIDWSQVSNINDVAQVVDGKWEIEGDTVRPTEIGYDRLINVGGLEWTNYEITVPITVHSIDEARGDLFPSAGPAVGLIMRWPGHYEWDSRQPRWGFAPLGALGWYRWQANGFDTLTVSDGNGLNAENNNDFVLEMGTPYMFKMRVETDRTSQTPGHRYTLAVWKSGEPETTATVITHTAPLTGLGAGSVLLVAHHADASFGRVEVSRINSDISPTISPASGTYNAGRLVSITSPAPNATIYYTTDGRPPTRASSVYSGPFMVHADTEVKAVAIREGVDVSAVTSELYLVRNNTPIKSDDFSKGFIDPAIWQTYDPLADVKFRANAQAAEMVLPAGVNHDLFTGRLHAPRLLQHAPDTDFEVQTKIDGIFAGSFTMQGIIAQQNGNDFIRTDIYRARVANGRHRLYVFMQAFANGAATGPAVGREISGDYTAQIPVWLRLKRQGNDFTVSSSMDGVNWVVDGTINRPMQISAVGLWTGKFNTTPSAIGTMIGQFDYFQNNAAPIANEDGTPPANVEPTVDAGANLQVTLPANATLTSTAADDAKPAPPGALTRTWTQVSGPGTATISAPSAASTAVSFPAAGNYVFLHRVSDGALTASDTVAVTVNANPGAPVVKAETAVSTATVGSAVELDGTVTDDGLPQPPAITTTWSVDEGAGAVTFANASNRQTTATFATKGSYVLRLTATDGQYTSYDRVAVQIVPARTRNGLVALYDFRDQEGDVISDISAVGQPLDLHIGNPNSVTWTEGTLTLDEAVQISSFQPATKINDAVKASGEITVETWVRPSNLAQSGPARIVTISEDTSLRNFTLGVGPEGPETGQQITARTRTTGTDTNGLPAVTTGSVLRSVLSHIVYTRDAAGNARIYVDGVLVQSGTVTGNVSNWDSAYHLGIGGERGGGRPFLGEYSGLAVYNRALSATEISDQFIHGPRFVGANLAPQVNAGPDAANTMPAPLSLGGSVIDDRLPTRRGLQVAWSVVSGPGTVAFSSVSDPAATATFSAPGTYVLSLRADDGQFARTDTKTVTVAPVPPNVRPQVEAGGNQSIERVGAATLNGTVTDDGLPYPATLTWAWSKVSGPGNVLFGDATALATTAVFTAAGTYTLGLTANDGDPLGPVVDTMLVTVVEPARVKDGLIALYPFDEGSGRAVRDVAGVGAAARPHHRGRQVRLDRRRPRRQQRRHRPERAGADRRPGRQDHQLGSVLGLDHHRGVGEAERADPQPSGPHRHHLARLDDAERHPGPGHADGPADQPLPGPARRLGTGGCAAGGDPRHRSPPRGARP